MNSDDVAVGVAESALGFLIAAMGACLVLLARDLDVARTQLSWLSAGFGVALLAAGPAGPALLRRGAHLVLRGSSTVLATGSTALALAPDLLLAQAGALLLGAGAAGIVLAGPALLTGPEAARRLSVANAIASLAGILGPLALSGTDLLPGSGRLALLLVVPPLVWVVVRSRHDTAGEPHRAAVGSPPRPLPSPWRRAQARPVVLRWLAMVLSVTAEFAFAVWGAARLQDAGLPVGSAVAGAAAFPLGMATGRLAGARLLGRIPVVPISVLLVLLGVGVLAAPAPAALCVAALAIAGLGIAVLYPVTLARLMHTTGLGDSRAAALGATASGTAILGGPLMIGALAAAGSLRAAFLGVIPLMLLLLALHRRD
jgi:MFS family permease